MHQPNLSPGSLRASAMALRLYADKMEEGKAPSSAVVFKRVETLRAIAIELDALATERMNPVARWRRWWRRLWAPEYRPPLNPVNDGDY